jgi:DNA-binding IclR family transcriptional regulator
MEGNAISLDEMAQPRQDYVVRSVTRALDVLVALSEAEGPVDLGVLSTLVGLAPATTLRMVESLRTQNLVRRARHGGYEVGAGAFQIGAAFLRTASVLRDAPGIAEDLASRVGETANVGVLDEGQVLYVAIANAQFELGILGTVGKRHPAHCTALGKILLAHLPWDEVLRVLEAHPPTAPIAGGLADREALRVSLALAAKRGFAIDDQERTPGVVCIAAPLRDHTNEVVAAVSISGPAIRITSTRIPELADKVMRAADEASSRLGAVPSGVDRSTERIRP